MRALTEPSVRQALKDPAFLSRLPEFRQLAGQLNARKPISSCCGGRSTGAKAMLPQFTRIVSAMPPERQRELTVYFGGPVSYNQRTGNRLAPKRRTIT